MQCYHSQLETLRERIAQLEGGPRRQAAPAVSSGCRALDEVLPGKGFRPGTLVEWLGDAGAGASTLVLRAAREACLRGGGVLVVLDRSREFYPPAAARLGIDLSRLILLYTDNQADHDWALDQVLRSAAVSAVVAWPEAGGGKLDGRTFRRLQLAAEEGGGLGLLVRPEAVRREPSWADVRLAVEPGRLTLLRCRGGTEGRSVEVDDATNRMPKLQIDNCKLQIAN